MRPTFQLLAKQCCIVQVPPRIAIDAGAGTRVGSHRTNNEDGHYVDSEGHIAVVADGIGGALAGERASQMAVNLLPRGVSSGATGNESSEEAVFDAIGEAFAEANAEIIRVARQNIQFHRMGTTAVMALVIGPRLHVASIGDSRAYLVRGTRIEQLTTDHTIAQALVEAGTITREEALRHQWRNVLSKYLGSDVVDNAPDTRVVDLQGNDRILLASDGLTNVVEDRTMLRILQENSDAQEAASALIHAAKQQNAHDDATCVVLFVKELEEPALSEWCYDSGCGIGLAIKT
jgi:protein phosphatase